MAAFIKYVIKKMYKRDYNNAVSFEEILFKERLEKLELFTLELREKGDVNILFKAK